MAEILFTNNASSTLFTTIDDLATEITVAPGTGELFPVIHPAKDEHFRITLISTTGDFEILKVTARVEDRFTVARGQEGTTAKNFEQGSVVELRLTAGGLNWISGRIANVENAIGFDESGTTIVPSDSFVLAIVNHSKFKHANKHAKNGSDPITPVSIGGATGDSTGNAVNSNQWGGSAIFRSTSTPSDSVGKTNDIWFQYYVQE